MPTDVSTYYSQSSCRGHVARSDLEIFPCFEEEADDQGKKDNKVDDVCAQRADEEDER